MIQGVEENRHAISIAGYDLVAEAADGRRVEFSVGAMASGLPRSADDIERRAYQLGQHKLGVRPTSIRVTAEIPVTGDPHPVGPASIGAAVDGAVEEAPAADYDDDDPPPAEDDGRGPPGDYDAGGASGRRGAGPSPLVPLGMNSGTYYYLTPSGQLAETRANGLQKLGILGLYEAEAGWLHKAFQQTRLVDGEEVPTGWNASKAAEWLIHQAARCGLFDPSSDLRGAGAWPRSADLTDPPIAHCGGSIYDAASATWHDPGRYEGKVWPTLKPQPRPADEAATREEVDRLLALLGRWNWAGSRAVSARLVLGWIAAAMVPACLDWRPHVWVSGDKGTGKTTLLDLLHRLLGDAALHLADTSEAGVRQALGISARPVLMDEVEPEGEVDRVMRCIRLARLASSRAGGKVARGSIGGNATLQSLETVFLFSSITRPPLPPQDLDRLTLLELWPLEAGAEGAASIAGELRSVGRLGGALRRRLFDRWRQVAPTLAAFQYRMSERRIGAREADQVGTLLALAWVIIHDEMPPEATIDAWVEEVRRGADGVERASEHDRCLSHLLTASVPNWRAGRPTVVGELVREALAECGPNGAGNAMDALRSLGIAIVDPLTHRQPASPPENDQAFLAVANNHHGLYSIFDGTDWGDRGHRSGAWPQLLLRCDGASRSPNAISFHGQKQRATLIPLATCGLATADELKPEAN